MLINRMKVVDTVTHPFFTETAAPSVLSLSFIYGEISDTKLFVIITYLPNTANKMHTFTCKTCIHLRLHNKS